MILLLHEFGADLNDLDTEGRRSLLGLDVAEESAFDDVSRDDYLSARFGREGHANPSAIVDRFPLAMIRSGWSAYGARRHFDDPATFACGPSERPQTAVWCFDRFGQSTTLLPDGRIVLVAGEHEDAYDPDFCIYNDVAVFGPDGSIELYGYPYDVFPPTNFHTATLVGSWIYLMGSLGYMGQRGGSMPVYRLSTADYHVERVSTAGEDPGWVSRHRTTLVEGTFLRIEGGRRFVVQDGEESYGPNEGVFRLDLRTMVWARE